MKGNENVCVGPADVKYVYIQNIVKNGLWVRSCEKAAQRPCQRVRQHFVLFDFGTAV